MKLARICSVVVLLLAGVNLHAQGIVLVEQQTRVNTTSTNLLQLDKSRIRVESRASGQNLAFVLEAGNQGQTVRILNLDKKTYQEFNLGFTQQQQTRLRDQLLKVQPERLFAEVIRNRANIPNTPVTVLPSNPEYRQTVSDRVGVWPCTKYDGFRGQTKVMEICAVDPTLLAVAAADFNLVGQLVQFLKLASPEAANQMVTAGGGGPQGFPGIAIRRTSYVNARAETVSEITAVRREAIPASVFDIPPDFTKVGGATR